MTGSLSEIVTTGVVHAAASAAVLAGLVWAVTAALGDRLPAAWRCGLWLLVLARLAVPVAGPVPVPLPHFLTAPDAPAPAVRFDPPPPPPPTGAVPVEPPPPRVVADPISPAVSTDAAPAVSVSAAKPTVPLPSWPVLLLGVWAGGAGFGLVRLLVRTARLRRAVRGRADVTAPAALAVLGRAAADAGVKRPVRWVVSDAGPAVCGARRPAVLLPAGLLVDAEALQAAALHELGHVRRRDVAVGVITSVVRCLWWPHPAAHLAAAKWRADRELACDAFALARLSPADRPAYGRLLVSLAARPAPASPLPAAAAGLFSPFPPLKRRIEAMTRYTPTSRRARVVGSALLFAVAALAVAAPVPAAPPADATPPAIVDEVREGAVEEVGGEVAETVTLAGVAVDEHDEPVSGARVTLVVIGGSYGETEWTFEAETVAGRDGRFRFENVRPLISEEQWENRTFERPADGRWATWVFAAAPGRATAGAAFGRRDFVADGAPKSLPEFVRLELGPPATFAGRIRYADGSPAKGLIVHGGPRQEPAGLAGLRSARVGPDGRFAIDDLAPFDAVVEPVTESPDGEPVPPGAVRAETLYFFVSRPAEDAPDPPPPGAAWTDQFSTMPFDMEVGDVPGEIDVTLHPLGTLRGRVTNADGRPVEGVEVRAEARAALGADGLGEEFTVLAPPEAATNVGRDVLRERRRADPYPWLPLYWPFPNRYGSAKTDADGRYVLPDLPAAGRLTVYALDEAGGRVAALADQAVEPGGTADLPPLTLAPGGLLTGGFSGSLNPLKSRLEDGTLAVTVSPADAVGDMTVAADATGRFAVRLPPGRYVVRPPEGPGWRLNSRGIDGRTWTDGGLDVEAGQTRTVHFRREHRPFGVDR